MMNDEIDNFLTEIGAKDIVPAENKDAITIDFKGVPVSIDDEDALMAGVFSTALEDKKKADELYKVMEDRLNFDKDRSPEAKTVLSEAVGHRINATNNLIKLMELRNKQKTKIAQGNSLVSLNLSPRETGININKLTDEILNS